MIWMSHSSIEVLLLMLFCLFLVEEARCQVTLDGDNTVPGPGCIGAGWFDNNNKCEVCPIGSYCPAGITFAKPCETGTFQVIFCVWQWTK
jgi:hypothetical protein